MSQVAHTTITRGNRPEEGMLIAIKGPSSGREFILVGQEITIGRGEHCDILLVDLNVSRKHAIVRNHDGEYSILDHHSRNGLLINGKKTRQKILKDGDIVIIGESLFRFRFGRPNTTRSRSMSFKGQSVKQGANRDLHIPLQSRSKFSLPNWLAKSGNKKSKSGSGKRIPLYLGAALIIGVTTLASFRAPINKSLRQKLATKTMEYGKPPTQPITAVAVQKTLPQESTAAVDRTNAMLDRSLARQKYSQATQLMFAGDFRQAIVLYDTVLQLDPSHPVAARKLSQAKQSLDDQIQQYYNSGLREFANLYYERAIQAWETAKALSSNYSDDYHKKSAAKIAEANSKIAESR